jgi:hypothetical protein
MTSQGQCGRHSIRFSNVMSSFRYQSLSPSPAGRCLECDHKCTHVDLCILSASSDDVSNRLIRPIHKIVQLVCDSTHVANLSTPAISRFIQAPQPASEAQTFHSSTQFRVVSEFTQSDPSHAWFVQSDKVKPLRSLLILSLAQDDSGTLDQTNLVIGSSFDRVDDRDLTGDMT